MTTKAWFEADKEGLAKILERRGKEFAVAELISNAWDQDVTRVDVTLELIPGRRAARLIVTDDDPNGFANLRDTYTLFGESTKKANAEKRGRFDLGEKLVLSICDEASIISTTGGVRFDDNGRHQVRERREAGSQFSGVVRMTTKEFDECCAFVRTLIPPHEICTMFNGQMLLIRPVKAEFELPLETHLADEQGVLRKTVRKAKVRVYDPLPDEVPSLYELGIPVVETDDKWHIEVMQKVPLSLERDNVPPAYLRKLRTAVLNELFQQVRGDEAAETWVKQATESPDATPAAVNHVITEIFGQKRVIFDPSDPEANKIAVERGYAVIHPRSLSHEQWVNVKEYGLALPAGRVTPSPKAEFQMAKGAEDSKFVRPEKYTDGMRRIIDYSKMVARALGAGPITVSILNDMFGDFTACYGAGELTFNVGKLGYRWFEEEIGIKHDMLIIHELAHHWVSDHLSHEYHDKLCELGATLKHDALQRPEKYLQFTTQKVWPQFWPLTHELEAAAWRRSWKAVKKARAALEQLLGPRPRELSHKRLMQEMKWCQPDESCGAERKDE